VETLGLQGSALAAASVAEANLIARAQQGDEAAFAEIYGRYNRRVFALCLRLTRVPADAEDLTQEVFLLLFRKISTFRGESAFSTWLHRMVANVAFMHLRKKARPPISLDDEGTFPDEPVRREVADHDLRLKGCIDRVTLERAIAGLPPGYRAVYALYELQGYGHHEIAEIMNWSVGNSKSQLHKARRKLRAFLSCRIRPLPGGVGEHPKERKPAVRRQGQVPYIYQILRSSENNGSTLRRGDAKVYKRYSQAKLNIMREALPRLDRHANEHQQPFATVGLN
jgi:RNA polymerase sigma-70 factor (ECF subfamily)